MSLFPSSAQEISAFISKGLSEAEVEKRRAEFGPNLLEEKKRKPAWRLFLEQFQDFMILILMVAALISGVAG
ncbi:MAG TPA: hypothetical protein DCL81_22585, partial [Algoriphagus sp.]|nr:hypothetical protein [Algoriphagus sp.]